MKKQKYIKKLEEIIWACHIFESYLGGRTLYRQKMTEKEAVEALYQLHLEGVREDYELGTEVLKISKKYADTFIALSQDMKKVAVKIEQREKLKK